MSNTSVTIYFVGDTPAKAIETLAFDSRESADDYRQDTDPTSNIYSVRVAIHLDHVVLDSAGEPPEPDYEWLDEVSKDADRYQDERTDLP